MPYKLPCGHYHCGKCLREFVCEPGEGKQAGKIVSECSFCRDKRTFKSFADIPCDVDFAAEAEGLRFSYDNEDVGQQMGRHWVLPEKPRPENVMHLTDCVAHFSSRCSRKVGAHHRTSSL